MNHTTERFKRTSAKPWENVIEGPYKMPMKFDTVLIWLGPLIVWILVCAVALAMAAAWVFGT